MHLLKTTANLKSHPNVEVRKKARQVLMRFQAMEMMRVKTASFFFSEKMGCHTYFEAFIDKKPNFTPQEVDMVEGASDWLLKVQCIF